MSKFSCLCANGVRTFAVAHHLGFVPARTHAWSQQCQRVRRARATRLWLRSAHDYLLHSVRKACACMHIRLRRRLAHTCVRVRAHPIYRYAAHTHPPRMNTIVNMRTTNTTSAARARAICTSHQIQIEREMLRGRSSYAAHEGGPRVPGDEAYTDNYYQCERVRVRACSYCVYVVPPIVAGTLTLDARVRSRCVRARQSICSSYAAGVCAQLQPKSCVCVCVSGLGK